MHFSHNNPLLYIQELSTHSKNVANLGYSMLISDNRANEVLCKLSEF